MYEDFGRGISKQEQVLIQYINMHAHTCSILPVKHLLKTKLLALLPKDLYGHNQKVTKNPVQFKGVLTYAILVNANN